MSRSAFDAYTDRLFKKLGILNLERIYKLQIWKFEYQYKSGLFPDSFNNMFLAGADLGGGCRGCGAPPPPPGGPGVF